VVVDYASRQAPRLPDIQASAFVVADAGTGQVLAAKDPHGWYRPASTLKMLTAVTLIPLLNPDATVVASKQATSTVPNVAGLVTGRAYKISDLFTALLTISANDAAIALTQASGSFSKGMALINAEARHLQADDTAAVDPNGLDAPDQHTSAYDLALVARQALTQPAFLKYDQTISARFVVARHKAVTLFNQNSLLTNYPGAVGGKIGWTSAAGATYVGMATRHGVTLIVTLLHCPALTEVKSAETLLNWGFSAGGQVAPAGTLVSPRQPPSAAPTAAASPRPRAREQAVARPRPAAPGPSVLAAAGFSGVAVAAAIAGFAYSRRQRLRSASSGRYPGPLSGQGRVGQLGEGAGFAGQDSATGPDGNAVTALPVRPSHPNTGEPKLSWWIRLLRSIQAAPVARIHHRSRILRAAEKAPPSPGGGRPPRVTAGR
jgi:D-alanyl-D-alanine carboxypeptidase (penicillin-binding protein 5/6)